MENKSIKFNYVQDGVEELFSSIAEFSIELQKTSFIEFPQLIEAKLINYWEFFITVSSSYIALLTRSESINEGCSKDKLYELVLEKLKKFHLIAPDEFIDLENFILKVKSQEKKSLSIDYLIELTGYWVLINLTDFKTIIDEKRLVQYLGSAIVNKFRNFFS